MLYVPYVDALRAQLNKILIIIRPKWQCKVGRRLPAASHGSRHRFDKAYGGNAVVLT